MARTPDPLRKRELLDSVVDYLAEQGLADTTLRPMAAALGVSINRLVHHFGSKEELITAALARAIDRQIEVQRKWLQRSPKLFEHGDCGAGHEFLVVTSDRRIEPCSFHDQSFPIESVDDLIAVWRRLAGERPPSRVPGCARVPAFELSGSIPVTLEVSR